MTEGTVLEVKPEESLREDVNDMIEFEENLLKHVNVECLNIDAFDNTKPFAILSTKMVNVLPTGQIKKLVIRNGYGVRPDEGAQVKINYNAYIEYEPQPFDSTYARNKPYFFTIGEGEVLEGLEIAVLTMQLNEKSQFLIHPDLAYRASGLNRIPSNSHILFEIELILIRDNVANENEKSHKRSFIESSQLAMGFLVKGGSCFRAQNYEGAIKEYRQGTNLLERTLLDNYEEQLECEELLLRFYTNLLVCAVLCDLPKKGCIFAQSILELAKNNSVKINAKVYFNHAKCLRRLGNFGYAHRQLQIAKRLEPNNAEITKEIKELEKAKKADKQRNATFGKALISGR